VKDDGSAEVLQKLSDALNKEIEKEYEEGEGSFARIRSGNE
jgi:hypothetical protein